MANRFPLVVDTSDGNKIKEIPAGDNLDLRQVSIVDVQDINALGIINAASVSVNGQELKPSGFLNLTDTPESYVGNENLLVRVNSAGTGIEFFALGGDETPLAVANMTVRGDILPIDNLQHNIGSDTQKFDQLHGNYFKGSIKGYDGSTVFDATTNQIPYSVIVGGPTVISDLANDAGYVTQADLAGGSITVEVKNTGDLQGSVFGEDSTLLVDHINGRINAARLTRNGANDGQTIVWNNVTELWEPGTAGDITGFASNKTDTLTVQNGYKIVFEAPEGNLEGNQINITPAPGFTVDLGNTRMQATAGIQPTNNEEGFIGTASKKFNEGHFVTLTADTLLGAFQGDLVNNETRSNAVVAGDKNAANGGYGFHLVNTTGGVTNASLNFNNNNLIAANLVAATGDLIGNVYSDDSTVLVDGLNGKIAGDIRFPVTEGYIQGKNINIDPDTGYFVKLGDTEVVGTITPEIDGTAALGSVSKKFGTGYFTSLNVADATFTNLTAGSLTATSFTVEGEGVGTFSSGGDLVLETGNRVRVEGGLFKLPQISTSTRDGFPVVNGDVIYNTTTNRAQFRQDSTWVELNAGTFNGNLIGDATGNIDNTNLTVGATATSVTVGHAAATNQVDGDTTFGHNVIVTGNFTVNGTTTSVDSVNLEVEDNTILLNKNETGSGVTAGSAGIEVERGTEANSSILWSEGDDRWYINGGALNAAFGIITSNITATSVEADFKGSVFADDSSILVDAVNGGIRGPITSDSWNIGRNSFLTIANGGDTAPGPIQIVASAQLDLSAGAGYTINTTRQVAAAGGIKMPDGIKAVFGTDDDLEMWHTGTNGIIQNTTGELQLSGDTIRLLNAATNEDFAYFNNNGSVDLYYDNALVLSTNATGVTTNVTGNIDNTNLTVGATATTTTISNASGRIDAASTIRMLGTPLASIENEEQTSTIRLFDSTYSGTPSGAQILLQSPLTYVSNDLKVDGANVTFVNRIDAQDGIKGSVYSTANALIIDASTGTLAGDGITGQGTSTFQITTPDTTGAAVPQAIELLPGDAQLAGQDGGNINLLAGASNTAIGGSVILRAGGATAGTGGNIYLDGGDSTTDGNVNIGTGHLTGATAEIIVGASGATDTTVNGNRFRLRTTNIPSSSKGSAGDRIGEVAFDGASIYFCVADYTNGSPDIWRKQNWQFGAAW